MAKINRIFAYILEIVCMNFFKVMAILCRKFWREARKLG